MFRVGRDLCGSPSPTPCPSTVTQSRLHSTTSRGVWNISREGDSTASLGSLGQGSVTLRGRSSSSCSAGASSASVCARCPLSCHWAPLNRVWPHRPDTHPRVPKHILLPPSVGLAVSVFYISSSANPALVPAAQLPFMEAAGRMASCCHVQYQSHVGCSEGPGWGSAWCLQAP